MEDNGIDEPHPPAVDLTLARAAASFKDADFFESCILFWSAAFEYISSTHSADSLATLIHGLDLEQDLGLDVQAEEPIELSFPIAVANGASDSYVINSSNISPVQEYIITALCYLARHINIRIDILPSGQDTLTSLGTPQRYYISLTTKEKEVYHSMLAVAFTTISSISTNSLLELRNESQDRIEGWNQQLRIQQSTALGNSATLSNWQTTLSQKRTPYSLPRFFSYLNTSSSTVAGCSIPRNEQDIDALEQAGFRLVITLIKESPLSASWFHRSQLEGNPAKRIKNVFVPIENRKAPGFPEVFETMMGWCVRTDHPDIANEEEYHGLPEYHHQRASLIHCGGGKGRAGIVLAAHLIRFGLLGHEGQGYCTDCIRNGNIHQYNLEQFQKGLGDSASVALTLPHVCSSIAMESNVECDEDTVEEEGQSSVEGLLRPVNRSECLNRFKPMMSAKDAITHLRELRPGSIETIEQEKSIKAYGDWLWKRSSSKSKRSKSKVTEVSAADTVTTQPTESQSEMKQANKSEKIIKKDLTSKPKPTPAHAPAPDDDLHEYSDDEYGKGRKAGKKGKKGSKKMSQEPHRVFVPPPPDKIIKIPGSHHHQHHLVVQHNLRARQLRGQKSKKDSGGGKQPKERPSFQVTGTPLASAPKLVILSGLPGSGKSHLVTSLLQEFPEHFVRISQDELGSRSVCERLLAQSMRHQQQSLLVRGSKKALPMTIFLDRCNPTMSERKEWYEVAFQPDECAIFWFSKGVEQCIERVDSREGHPTVSQGMGYKVVNSFAKGFEFPNLAKEGSWCKTLVEIGDDDGSNRLLEIMKKFAKEIPASSTIRSSGTPGNETTPIRARPAFIPARVLQRKNNSAAGVAGSSSSEPGFESPTLHSKSSSTGSMESVQEEEEVEEDEEEEEEEEESAGKDSEESSENEDSNGIQVDSSSITNETSQAKDDKADIHNAVASLTLVSPPEQSAGIGASQFATLTGLRPAVKKPTKGSWKNLTTPEIESSSNTGPNEVTSPKGVSFATPLSSFDRPLQKFPRTPHLFDPLTIRKQGSEGAKYTENSDSEPGTGRSVAISRSDLLLPPSALRQFFVPKSHQTLTVEEKMDGANIGFSVLHFKTIDGFAGITSSGPPPKIRIQNRNHFVHPNDHWQYKKLDSWLEKHRGDILWLCEGRWRYESDKNQNTEVAEGDENTNGGEEDESKLSEDEAEDIIETDDGDEAWADEVDDDEGEEYVDEDRVLQDGLAPYVLYGEWLYAKHSVHYTGLKSWFIPFDLFDIKTGTFVSRKLFRKAIAKTQLAVNPGVQIPKEIYGDVEKTLDWTLAQLQSRSVLMKPDNGQDSNDLSDTQQQKDRVEGLYFRIDQGDRLLMRSKIVRADFIAGEERWGAKEQVANKLVPIELDYDEDEDEDDEEVSK
ncbi:Dual specificity protein phosphatase 23 [Entomortierella beljakovae]|nr:Dual specificity protein phosphatase 23 [Entomortierella beljakovae]